jgi:hypothetical protein
MRRKLRLRLTYANIVATVAVCIALGAGSYALGAIPGSSGSIVGCYSNADGSLRVINEEGGAQCNTGTETRLAWNQEGEKGDPGVFGVYRRTRSLVVPASGSVRTNPTCSTGDRATGGGYFLNTTGLKSSQMNVEVYKNGPNTDQNARSPRGWDIAIKNRTSKRRTGFAFAVCADMTP